MDVIPALGRLRQEDKEFKASLDHITRSFLKKKKTQNLKTLLNFNFIKEFLPGEDKKESMEFKLT
jgi:hypothetical protein